MNDQDTKTPEIITQDVSPTVPAPTGNQSSQTPAGADSGRDITITDLPEGKLNLNQEAFCQLYATDRELFGNGVQSYIEVYNPDRTKPNWYKTACSTASEILSNPKVYTRINQLLEENGLNDAFVDKQLSFLLSQHADFTNKLGAIKEYNKLKQRITDRMDVTSAGKPIPILSTYVQPDDSHLKNPGDDQENPGNTGGNVGLKDNLDSPGVDRPSPAGQDSHPDLNNVGELSPPETGSDAGLQEYNEGASILA